MPLSTSEQELYDFARNSVPKFLFAEARSEEEILAMVQVFETVRAYILELFSQTRILDADEGPPDWLNQHARDRDTMRQDGEDNAALRVRLRTFQDAVTRPVLLSLVNDALLALGLPQTASMVETRYERAYFGTNDAIVGTGGSFTTVLGFGMRFTPDVAPRIFNEQVAHSSIIGPRTVGSQITFSGAANPLNDGTFTITSVAGDGFNFTNPPGFGASDPTVSWVFEKLDTSGNVLDGASKSFLSRGFRMGSQRSSSIYILPVGTTEAIATAILESVRQRRAAGVPSFAEWEI